MVLFFFCMGLFFLRVKGKRNSNMSSKKIPFITMLPNLGMVESQEKCATTCEDVVNGKTLINKENLCVCFVPPNKQGLEGTIKQIRSTLLSNIT